ncbi:MAG TPA: hypothetical protein VGS19_11965 [Streptosporangiaceae bacterium]|nr:hypothetical protein [Streptosporangiaceae bacterium]
MPLERLGGHDGGGQYWRLDGHASTNDELVAAAREQPDWVFIGPVPR